MSWQSYIDDQLLAAGFMYATINGFNGSLYASSPGFIVSPEEIDTLSNALESSDAIGKVQSGGFTIAGQKYTFVRGETADNDDNEGPAFLQGRCKDDGKSSQGVLVYKTCQAIVIGVHDPAYSNGASFGAVNTEIGRIADYLFEQGQ